MKKIVNKFRGIMLLNFLLLMTNCTTDESSKKEIDQGSVEAKIWYSKHQKDYSAPILKYIKELQWENVIITNGDVGEIIEVPFVLKDGLNVSNKMADLFNDHHRLMFIKNKQNEFNLFYVQIFTDEKNNKILDKSYNYYNLQDDFDGSVYVQELATNNTRRLEFKNGDRINSSSQTAKSDQKMCLYYGYWYEDGHFEPLVEMGCYGSPEQGGRDVPGYGGGGSGGKNSGTRDEEASLSSIKSKAQFISLIKNTDPNAFNFNFVQNGNTVIASAVIGLLPWANISLNIVQAKVNNVYIVNNVATNLTGATAGLDWSQTAYSQTTSGNTTTVVFSGIVSCVMPLQGLGTVYSYPTSYSIKINNTNGKIISGTRVSN
jgi:hypothetical protein